MRFGFKTSPQNTGWREIAELWQAADEIPLFESGWLSDHFHAMHGSDPTAPRLEGWTTLAALARTTRRLRLGLLVTGAHYRHPAVLANMAATLDVISDGRLEVGLGAGWNEEESAAYGIPLGSPRERSDRLEEACAVLAGLLGPEREFSFTGAHFQLSGAHCFPKPVQQPHPPLVIGGSGARRTLRTAARYAQHWNFDTGTVGDFVRARDALHAHCADLGRDPSEILVSAQVRHRARAEETARAAAEFAAAGAQLAVIYLPLPYDPKVLEPLAAALAELPGQT